MELFINLQEVVPHCSRAIGKDPTLVEYAWKSDGIAPSVSFDDEVIAAQKTSKDA